MESEMFEYLVNCICQSLSSDSTHLRDARKLRMRSACRTSMTRQKKKLSQNKSQKLSRIMIQFKSSKNKHKQPFEQQLSKLSFSEKKQRINEVCILCGKGPCDNRLACAHAIHAECFIKSSFTPLCRKCQSKNIPNMED